jgi:hypothetical protein
MIMRNSALDEITERLAMDFSGLVPFTILVAVLHRHVSDYPEASADLVEAATRRKLSILRQGDQAELPVPGRPDSAAPQPRVPH